MSISRIEKRIIIQGKPVQCIVEGNGPIPCLFIGPGALYLPTIPSDAKRKLFTFYDVDRYFAYPTQSNKVSSEEIGALTLDSYIEYYEFVRKALNLEKVAVMGPSAIGLVAHEYARRHPYTTTHVFMLGTPSTTKDLIEEQKVFLQGNYNPALRPRLATDWSISKWNRFIHAQERFEKEKKEGLTPDESLIKELVADQEKYSITPESEDTLRKRWSRFNTTMRVQFFGKMIPEYEIKGEVSIPTLAISGLYDAVAPFYDLGDKIQNRTIYGEIDQIILDDAAHSPQLESTKFTQCIEEWLKKQLPDQKAAPRVAPRSRL